MTFGAYWGGFPCSLDRRSPPRYVRARGLDASVSTVSFPATMFTERMLPRFDAARFAARTPDDISAHLRVLNETKPTSFVGSSRPPYVGDLVFAQARADGKPPREARARSLFFVEARSIDPESNTPLVEITLADVRRFWDDFGEITRSWNVPRPGGFVAHTAKERGAEPTPLIEVVQALLTALPGGLVISAWPEDLEEAVVDVRAWGGRPREALDDLLQAFRLELDPGPNMAARIFRAGEGKIGELSPGATGDNDLEHDPTVGIGGGLGVWTGAVTGDGNAYYQRPAHENPTEVLVVGGRTVLDASIDFMTPVLPYQAADPLTRSPVEHVIEATPQNLTDFVLNKLPGLQAEPDGEELLTGTLGGQARLDALRKDVKPAPATTPAPRSRAIAAQLAGSILDTLDGFRDQSIVSTLPSQPQIKKAPGLVGSSLGDFLIGEGGVLFSPEQPEGTVLVTHLWQRLPGLDAQEWPLELAEIPEEKRASLKKLWHVYQVPDQWRRLLRIRKRAEVDAKGRRLAPMCEAFGFRKTRVTITNPAIEEHYKDQAAEIQARALLAKAYEEKAGEAERLRREIDKVRLPTAAEIRLLDTRDESNLKLVGAALGIPDPDNFPDPIHGFKKTEGIFPSNPDQGQADTINRLFDRVAGDVLAELGLQGLDPEAASSAAREEGLRKELAKVETEMLELERKINPLSAAWKDMGALEAEAEQQRQSAGKVSGETTTKLAAKQAEIDKLNLARLAAPPYIAPTIEVTRLKNLGRRRVEFRILDAERGLIELQELPCWVADENVSSLDQTWVIPMPVRLTFGTVNSLDVEDRSVDEGPIPGYYMGVVGRALRKSPQLAALVGVTGSRIPRVPGDGQLRFAFSREDRSGAAAVGPYPYLVTIDDPDFRELVRLTGESNRPALLAQAGAIADALLDRPDDVDAGHLDVIEPREIALNGRISATSIAPSSKGGGFVTTVSFDSEPAPLGDLVEGLKRARGGLSFVFGIDVEADRD